MIKKLKIALVIIADLVMLFFGPELLSAANTRLNTIGFIIIIILIILNIITFKPLLQNEQNN